MEQIKEFFTSDLGVKLITIVVSLLVIYILVTLIKKVIPKIYQPMNQDTRPVNL